MQLYGKSIIDWKGINDIPPDQRKAKIMEAVGHFIKRVNDMPVLGAKEARGTDVNLMAPAPVALVTSDTLKTPDRGYEVLFDEVDMRQSTNSHFDLLGVTGGATFYQVASGEEAKLTKLPTSAKTPISMLRYIGGFAIPDDWLRFNQYYKIDELTADTVRRWFDNKATIFYGLIGALSSGINQAFATDDVTTINTACANILTDLSAAGFVVDENSEFAIVCHPTLRGRIMKALASQFSMPNTNSNQIVFTVRTVISTVKIVNTSYYVVLPGGKSKRGEWEDLNIRPPERNELALGADYIWTGAYNGAIGESKQFKRCALA